MDVANGTGERLGCEPIWLRLSVSGEAGFQDPDSSRVDQRLDCHTTHAARAVRNRRSFSVLNVPHGHRVAEPNTNFEGRNILIALV